MKLTDALTLRPGSLIVEREAARDGDGGTPVVRIIEGIERRWEHNPYKGHQLRITAKSVGHIRPKDAPFYSKTTEIGDNRIRKYDVLAFDTPFYVGLQGPFSINRMAEVERHWTGVKD